MYSLKYSSPSKTLYKQVEEEVLEHLSCLYLLIVSAKITPTFITCSTWLYVDV